MVEICSIGGYNEVGKNSTAIKIDDEVYVLDLGIHLENYVKYTKDEDIIDINPKKLMQDMELLLDGQDGHVLAKASLLCFSSHQ